MFSYWSIMYVKVIASIAVFNFLLVARSFGNLDTQLTEVTKCFHKLTSSDGEFHSPNYPGLYPNGIMCIWKISAEPGKRIKLIFADFELEDFPGCTHDSLSIFDGSSMNSTLLGNFCGTTIRQQIFSSSNSMVLMLTTNNFNGSRGFHAVYTTYSCGGLVTSQNGTLHSPFFPHFFRSNSNCIWRIPVKLNTRVVLNITLFTVKSEMASCKENYVRITSPDAMNKTKHQELICGSHFRAPVAVQSESRELEVEYSSSNLYESIFSAKFATIQDDCSLNISECEQLCEKIVHGYLCSCRDGYKLNDDGRGCSFVNASYSRDLSEFGEILSAGFPLKYAAYHRCTWKITAANDEQIILKFEEFDVEYSPGCRYDAVEISEEINNTSTTLGIYCGHEAPMPISSSRNNIVIFFRTDGLWEKKGFKITYATSKICGGNIAVNSSREVLNSPFYPGAYPDNLQCMWEITAPSNHVLVLNFTTFDIQSIKEPKDQVLIFSKHSENEAFVYEELSGPHLPSHIIANGNNLKVKFISHKPNGEEIGFAAEVYSEVNECLINNGGCRHICNKEIGSYRCNCPKGYIFKNESDTCVEDVCQYEIFSTSGVIRTPDFQHIHPINNTCHWLITTEERKRLFLNFTVISSALCKTENLELYFGNNTDVNSSVNLCSKNSPVEITSTDNRIYLVYERKNQTEKTEFFASFFSVNNYCAFDNGGCQHMCKNSLDGYECSCRIGYVLHENKHNCTLGNCSYTITSASGDFASPHFPNNYTDGIECFWLLNVPIDNIINLTFTHFEVESHSYCAYDRVSIFDGDSENSTSLGHFCGSGVPSPIFSSGNSLYVTFKSDAYMSFKGFQATHNTGCGGKKFVENELTLFSHMQFGKANYGDNTYCVWQIIASAHKRIIIHFYFVDIEVDATCKYDYVALYEEDGSLISQLCGSKGVDEEESFSSKSNVVRVRFRSDGSNTGRGFAATVRSV